MVLPCAEVVVMPDPEIDFVAYVDALQDISPRFQRLVCQVPNQRAMRVLMARKGVTVSLQSDPALAQPCVTCNIVASEQDLVNAMLPHTNVEGRKLLISSAPCRLPKGWTQMQASEAEGFSDAIGVSNKTTSMKLSVVMISKPELVSQRVVDALRAGNPSCILCAATHDTMAALTCQVKPNDIDTGRLAACMSLLGGNYKGQQSVVVEPVVVKPTIQLERCNATSLRILQQIGSL